MDLLISKPVLIGLHLGFAILGIDAFLWLFGELVAGTTSIARKAWAAGIGAFAFLFSWIIGGYYYVTFYGTLVKPIIKAGRASWAHDIVMETKEHIFLFIVPMAVTALFVSLLDQSTLERVGLKSIAKWLSATIAGLGLSIGLMGYIISAAARWGA